MIAIYAIHHGWNDGTWRREALGGAYGGSPDVVTFGGQLQTIGRGPEGALHTVWYDPVSGLWNVENQQVRVTD